MSDAPSPMTYRYWGSVTPPETRAPIKAELTQSDGSTTATMRVYDPIDSWGGSWGISAKEFTTALDALDKNVSSISLLINSPGGETHDAIAIMNALKSHPATVTATVEGIAASAASFLAASADNTIMAPNSQLMIHDAWGMVIGPADDLTAHAAVLNKMSDNLASMYADAAGGDPEDWRAAMKAETWYTAEEAVAAGLAQSVAKPKPSDVAPKSQFDLRIFNHAGRDDAPAPMIFATAVASHSTATSTSSWDGPANVSKLEGLPGSGPKMYAWKDGTADLSTKSAWKFPHHFVGADGTPGAASTKACQNGIAILNGGRGGADIPDGDRSGVYAHLARHLRDANLEPAPLDTIKPPAEPPVQPPKKEADAMSDTLMKALRERLNVADDAELDEDAILAEYDKQTEAAKAMIEAKAEPVEPKIPEGKTLVSDTLLAELREGAKDGREARTKQRAEERDAAIQTAWEQGKISADRRESWAKAWDVDSEGTKADLESLEVRFPVAKATGYAGSDGTDGEGTKPFSDEEAAALAQLGGISKEGLLA